MGPSEVINCGTERQHYIRPPALTDGHTLGTQAAPIFSAAKAKHILL